MSKMGSFDCWLNFVEVQNSFRQVELKYRLARGQAKTLIFAEPCFCTAILKSYQNEIVRQHTILVSLVRFSDKMSLRFDDRYFLCLAAT